MSFGFALRNSVSLGLGGIPSLASGSRGNNPTLNLNFTSGTLDPRVTFTRASTATFVGSNGLIQSAAINAPRFTYNPVTLAPLGLLIEEQRTNIIKPSTPDQAATDNWANGSAITSVTDNAVVAPDGTTTATAFVGLQGNSNASSGSSLRWLNGITTAGTYTISFYARVLAGSVAVNMRFVDGGAALDSTVAALNPQGNNNVSTTYQRFTATITLGSGSTGLSFIFSFATNSTTIYLWGAQLEAGAFATSFIPTVASQVTRSVDNAVMTGTNFSSWFNSAEGSFYAEAATLNVATNSGILRAVFTASSAERMRLTFASSQGNYLVSTTVGTQANVNLGAVTTNTFNKIAMAYKTNDTAGSLNGAAVVTDTSVILPTGLDTLQIGQDGSAATTMLNGTIKQISYYPQRLPNSQLQTLTS
jgi:hypothetical protein